MAKKHMKSRKSKSFINQTSLSIFYLLPVIFVITIVPLIVFAKILEIDGLEAMYWEGHTTQINFFHYYKSIYFIIASFVGGVILLVLYWSKKLLFIKSKYLLPLFVYSFFVIISTIFADDIDVALRGHFDLSQGVFVLIGYVILIITILNLVREEKHIKALVSGFVIVSLVVGLIGFWQYFGYDFFRSELGKLLILPKELHYLSEDLDFNFAKYAIYSTLYNTNFVGSFAALMIPLSFALYFYQKKFKYAFASISFVGLMIFIGFGSNSRAGILGVIAALLLIVIIFRNEILHKPFHIIVPFVIIIIVGFGLNTVSGGRVINSLKSMNLFNEISILNDSETVYIEDMIFDYYTLEILTKKEDLHIEFIDNMLYFSDLEGNPINVEVNDRKITFIDEKYQDYTFKRSLNEAYYRVIAYGHVFNIWLTIDGFKIEGLSGDLYIPSNPDKIDFLDEYGSLFSSRVYIWSRSIPLLKNFLFIGAGPDMFGYVFPQDDYVGKLNYSSLNVLFYKPHNMYLQTGINTGVVSLIAMLYIFGMYIIDSLKLYLKRKFNTFEEYIGAGLFVSVSAYLVAGVFNDQIMSVAPIFYAMLALGIAINRILSKKSII